MKLRALLPALLTLLISGAAHAGAQPYTERPFCQSEQTIETEEDEEPDCD